MNLMEKSEVIVMLNDVVDAIHQILDIEVTIIDSDYNRIAGTGRFACEVGGKVAKGSVFSEAIEKKKPFIVDQPGAIPICSQCENRGKCKETAQVCCPIILEEHVVGVIGLVAFDESQKDRLLNQRQALLGFLENMAKLIALKVKELQQAYELQVLTDCSEDLLMSVDQKGWIIRANQKAKTLAPILEDHVGVRFAKLYGQAAEDSLLSGDQRIQVQMDVGGQSVHYEAKVNPVDFEGLNVRYVVSVKPVRELIRSMNRWVENQGETRFDSILGDHPLLRSAIEIAKRTAESASTVLIQGESGTGKEMFARAIHSGSRRSGEVFLPINCAAIPEPLLESEFFGYEEGAFTGASKGGRIGRFEQAHKGTLFLDEIGDLPLHMQGKLLRVLQDGCFFRVGGKREIRVDVRIIAATNRPLEKMILEGEFREDLYYRINVIPIQIPPLRSRQSDILPLADAFIEKYNLRLGRYILDVSREAAAALLAYQWPGNVRELENAIEYAVNFTSGQSIRQEDLPRRLRGDGVLSAGENTHDEVSVRAGNSRSGFDCGSEGLAEQTPQWLTLEALENKAIIEAIQWFGESPEGIQKVCEALGISRATFYRRWKVLRTTWLESQNENRT